MRRERVATGVLILVEVVPTLWMLWVLLPAAQRRLLLMKTVTRLEKVTVQTARIAGSWGIQRELAGDAEQAGLSYNVAYGLMTRGVARTRRWYEELRSG